MNLPFTVEQFLRVFERYNLAIWPMHVVVYLLALVAIGLAVRPVGGGNRAIAAILASLWLWMGIVYHGLFFSQINPAAIGFGALFIIQGVLFLWAGVVRPGLVFQARFDGGGLLGGAFIVFAMLVYPIIGTLLGHGYPQSPSFGVAPCPTTIFTFGLLVWTAARVPKYLLVIPLLWSFIGFSAALTLGVREDTGLLVAGLVGTAVLVWRDLHLTPRPTIRPHQA
jgi:hypothetical protein